MVFYDNFYIGTNCFQPEYLIPNNCFESLPLLFIHSLQDFEMISTPQDISFLTNIQGALPVDNLFNLLLIQQGFLTL